MISTISVTELVVKPLADRAAHRLRTPDALILATALPKGGTAFATNDARLKRIGNEGISVLAMDDYLHF